MNSNAAAIRALEAKFEKKFETLDNRLSVVEKELRTLTTILKARQVVHGAKKENKQGLKDFVGEKRLASWHSRAHPVMRTKREALEIASNLQKSIVSKNGRFRMSVNEATAARDVLLRRSKNLGATNDEIENVRRGIGKNADIARSITRRNSGFGRGRQASSGIGGGGSGRGSGRSQSRQSGGR